MGLIFVIKVKIYCTSFWYETSYELLLLRAKKLIFLTKNELRNWPVVVPIQRTATGIKIPELFLELICIACWATPRKCVITKCTKRDLEIKSVVYLQATCAVVYIRNFWSLYAKAKQTIVSRVLVYTLWPYWESDFYIGRRTKSSKSLCRLIVRIQSVPTFSFRLESLKGQCHTHFFPEFPSKDNFCWNIYPIN